MAVFMLSAAALAAFVFSGGAAATGWFIQIVDRATQSGCDLNELGYDTSLDFGPGNVPHISYYDESNGDLKYATWQQYADGTGHWLIQRVDTKGKVGKDTSIDVSGNVYISYYDDSNKDLKFAYNSAGYWQYEVADNGGGSSRESSFDVGEDTSMHIGSDGLARVSYFNDSANDLKYAIRVGSGGNCGGGKWKCTTIDSNDEVGQYTSLALDAGNKAHISYYDHSHGNLKYAHEVDSGGNCGGGKWRCETIDGSSHNVGEHTSIALDAGGYPQVAYEDESWGDLKYACKTAGGWNIYTVAGDGPGSLHTGEDTSLKIGSDGRPRISFHDETHEDLEFAVRTDVCGAPGTWQMQSVDTVGDQGEDNSLALKTDDTPCISYHDESNGNLKYACQASSPPIVSNIVPSGWITTASAVIGADYADNSGTGINLATVAVYLDSTLLSGCTATQSGVTCPQSGMTEGSHSILIKVNDNVGNSGGGSGNFQVDSIAPAVGAVLPAGSIPPGSATVSAYYSDTGSGVDEGTASLTLDGIPLGGCTVSATEISCSASGLTPGLHAIGGSVSDVAGNTSPIGGSFNVVCDAGKPALTLTCPTGGNVFWGSYADYMLRQLSVNYMVANPGTSDAFDVNITGSSCTNGVTLVAGAAAGDIPAGSSSSVTLKYSVPVGVTAFMAGTMASARDECNNAYTYPN